MKTAETIKSVAFDAQNLVPNTQKLETWNSTIGNQHPTTPKPKTQGLAKGSQCPTVPTRPKYENSVFS